MGQNVTQNATGTMVMLELDALGLDRARTACSREEHPLAEPRELRRAGARICRRQ